ncbi:MAG: MFS transporter [Paracoccaceae bacterium]|nr:MFS transporter [Paracoccaceae bacterium]
MSEDQATGPALARPLSGNRDFLAFILSRMANVMGNQIITVAVGWHVYLMTGDPLDLGLVGLSQFAPALALFLVAGLAADRFDRRNIIVLCNGLHVAAAAMLLVYTLTDGPAVWPIFAILVVHGTARAFYFTASQAILPNLVDPAVFPKAIAWSSSVNKAAQLIGPAAGGVLVAVTGDWTYLWALVIFALAGVAAWAISARLTVRGREPFSLAKVLGGFSFVWRKKIVLGAISIDLLAVLFGGVMGLLPIYAKDILDVGADGLGVMRAMPAVGSLIVGLALTRLTAPRHMGPAFFVSLAIFGTSILVFGLSEIYWLSLLALGIYGAADMVSVYIRLTLIQLATPDQMRGRVSAVNAVAINASNELGDFRAGVSAALIGTVPAVMVGGAATLGVTALWVWLFPEMRKVDRLEEISAREKSPA